MTQKLDINSDHDPLLWVKFTGKVRIQDFEEQARVFEHRIKNDLPYCVLIDYRRATGFTSPGIGKFWNEWTDRHFDLLHRNVWVSATVFSNALISSIANVVLMTARIPHPQKSFRKVNPALSYLCDAANRRGADLDFRQVKKLA